MAKSGTETDIAWIKQEIIEIKNILKDADGKYAGKWTEYLAKIGIIGLLGWAGNQLLALIPRAYALIAYYVTTS